MQGVSKKAHSLRELHRLAREKLGEKAAALKTREELTLALSALGPLPAPRVSAPRAPRVSAPRSAAAPRPDAPPAPRPSAPKVKPSFEPRKAKAAAAPALVTRDFFLEPPSK